MRRQRALWGAAVAAQTVDIVTTAAALRRGGTREGNPALAPVFEAVGVIPGLVAATAMVFAVAAGFWIRTRAHARTEHLAWLYPAVLAVGGAVPGVVNAVRLAGVVG